MHIKNKRGQSTVEYILLVTAVIAVMIVFATNNNGGLQSQLNQSLNTATADIGAGEGVLSASHQAGTTSPPGTNEALYQVPVIPGTKANPSGN